MSEEKKIHIAPNPEQETAEKPQKKSFWKRILDFAAVLLIIILVLAACILIFIDPIVKWTVKLVGPEVTGTPMELAVFDSSILGGSVAVEGLAVGNPDGYNAPNALVFNSLYIKIDKNSLLTDTIVVEEVLMDGLQVDYEIQSGLNFGSLFSSEFGDFAHSESNLTRILESVEDFARRLGADAEKEEKVEEEETSESSKQVKVKLIRVTNTTISFSSAMLNSTLPIPMPDFEIGEQKDTTFVEVISVFFQELYTNVIEAVAIYLQENSIQLAESIGEGLTVVGDGMVEGVTVISEGVTDGVIVVSEGVTEGMTAISESVTEGVTELTTGIGEQLNTLTEGLKLDKTF